MFSRRFDPADPELMDRPQAVNAALVRGLENLGEMNRRFGALESVRRFFKGRLEGGREYEILDLATGGGDIPRLVADACRREGVRVRIEAVDFRGATLEVARGWSEGYPEIRYTEADILAFAPEREYDYVLCSLALHHFGEEDAVRVLERAASLAKRGVLVSDLVRSRFASFCIHFITATIYRDEMTREDGRKSARRAFAYGELEELAKRAGWTNYGHRRVLPARQDLWMYLEAGDQAAAE